MQHITWNVKHKKTTLKANHKHRWLHGEKVRLLTAQRLEISSAGRLLCILGAVRVCLPGSWITAAIENQQGPQLPCVYRINAQTRGL